MRHLVMVAIVLSSVGLAAQLPWREQVTIDGDPVFRGLPKDVIPAIDRPTFVSAAQATSVADDEPVIGVVIDGVARAYPTWLLNGHEIVNDAIGPRRFAVTW